MSFNSNSTKPNSSSWMTTVTLLHFKYSNEKSNHQGTKWSSQRHLGAFQGKVQGTFFIILLEIHLLWIYAGKYTTFLGKFLTILLNISTCWINEGEIKNTSGNFKLLMNLGIYPKHLHALNKCRKLKKIENFGWCSHAGNYRVRSICITELYS